MHEIIIKYKKGPSKKKLSIKVVKSMKQFSSIKQNLIWQMTVVYMNTVTRADLNPVVGYPSVPGGKYSSVVRVPWVLVL